MPKAGYSLKWGLVTGCICSQSLAAVAAAGGAATPENFANLSLEELSDVRVVSVSKREERLGDAPASIFVISADDIRRSGARSLAEALRMAPNLHVAQTPAGNYTITARGFAGNSANKQLVMIDGRSVYTPLLSGVSWDVQQVPMDAIERIEVVSGPGGTLWGTNAVNGVINVITKPAASTLGAMADLRWGRSSPALPSAMAQQWRTARGGLMAWTTPCRMAKRWPARHWATPGTMHRRDSVPIGCAAATRSQCRAMPTASAPGRS